VKEEEERPSKNPKKRKAQEAGISITITGEEVEK
jgi:hypothetical protein